VGLNIAKKQQTEAAKAEAKLQTETKPVLSFEEQKEAKKKKTQLQNQLKKSEEEIANLESKIAEMDLIIADLDYSDDQKSTKTLQDYAELKTKLDAVMLVWEETVEALETV
jgi:ATP-binding cassette subfamily F protein 3